MASSRVRPVARRSSRVARRACRLGAALGLLLIAACQPAGGSGVRRPPVGDLMPASGFQVGLFALVPGASALAAGEDGVVHVATERGELVRLRDHDQDGIADEAVRLEVTLRPPVALAAGSDGTVHAFGRDRIVRLKDGKAATVVPSGVLPVPDGTGRRHLARGPDHRLYFPLGRSCDGCRGRNLAGSILDMRPDGHELRPLVRGLSDPGAIDWQPRTGQLTFIDQVRNPAPSAEHVAGLFQLVERPTSGPETAALAPVLQDQSWTELVPELTWTFAPGLAPAAMAFYDGDRWPGRFWHALLVVLNPADAGAPATSGSQVMALRFGRDGEPRGEEVLLAGFERRDGRPWGRPVDIEQHADDAVLIADQLAGAVYRLAYR